MINFESQYFQKLAFKEEQIEQFLKSALHDLKIAEESDIPDVVFKKPLISKIRLDLKQEVLFPKSNIIEHNLETRNFINFY